MLKTKTLSKTNFISTKKLMYICKNYKSVINYLVENENTVIYLNKKNKTNKIKSEVLLEELESNILLYKLPYNDLLAYINLYISRKSFELNHELYMVDL